MPAHRIYRNPFVFAIAALVIYGAILYANDARAKRPEPVAIPPALQKARDLCPNQASIPECRAALVESIKATDWQRRARNKARAMTVRSITLDAINWAAHRYHVSAWAMRSVGNCESHLWPFATNGQYAGWAQLSTRHRRDPIFDQVPWQDAYAVASHVARYVRAHGWSEWQCQPGGGLRW